MSSSSLQDVLITGLGVVSPIGNSRSEIWQALETGRSGVDLLPPFANVDWMVPFGGRVSDFEPKHYVKPRKSLKVMCREMQLAMAAAELAWQDSGLGDEDVPPDRGGVVAAAEGSQYCDLAEVQDGYRVWLETQEEFDVRAMPREFHRELFPLWMLKYLPNLNACHIAIRRNFRGPLNTIGIREVSSLCAISEAAQVIRRGVADVMIAGGSSSTIAVTSVAFHMGARASKRADDPQQACRPFDLHRDGLVYGEGAAFLVLESRAHAARRGAEPIARVGPSGRCYENSVQTLRPTGVALASAISSVLERSSLSPGDIGHVNAHGVSTPEDDIIEAKALRASLGNVPVTAPKSFIGNSGAAAGAIELAISLIASEKGYVPPTLNYATPDPNCPVNVSDEPRPTASRAFISVNQSATGQAVATLIEPA